MSDDLRDLRIPISPRSGAADPVLAFIRSEVKPLLTAEGALTEARDRVARLEAELVAARLEVEIAERKHRGHLSLMTVAQHAVQQLVSPEIFRDAPALDAVIEVMVERAREPFWHLYGTWSVHTEPVRQIETDAGPALWPCGDSAAEAYRVIVSQRGVRERPNP